MMAEACQVCLEMVPECRRVCVGNELRSLRRLRKEVADAAMLRKSRHPVVMSPSSLMSLQQFALDEVDAALKRFGDIYDRRHSPPNSEDK